MHSQSGRLGTNAAKVADRTLDLITRAQMLTATERGHTRLTEIGAKLDDAALENVLAPLATRSAAARRWRPHPGQQGWMPAGSDRTLLPAQRAQQASVGSGDRSADPSVSKLACDAALALAARLLVPSRLSGADNVSCAVQSGGRPRRPTLARCAIIALWQPTGSGQRLERVSLPAAKVWTQPR